MVYPIPNNYVAPAPVPQDSHLIQELSAPIYQARGWLKFLGILSIIGGIVQALSIVGIIYAWLPIWMGVVMYQAGTSIESAGQFGDRFGFSTSLNHLKTYFVIQGVLTLVGIIVVLAAICILFVMPLVGISLFSIPSVSNILGGY